MIISRLPKRDRQMFAILMAVMLAADVAASTTIPDWKVWWPAFVIMPGTLWLVALSYQISLVVSGRIKTMTPEILERMSLFMGRTLSLAAGVLTVGHLGLLGFAAGWIDAINGDAFLHLFMTALSVMLILLHNRMPKLLMAHAPQGLAQAYLRASWVGVLCGLVMIVIVWTLPVGGMTAPFLITALIPTAAYLIVVWMWRRSQTTHRR